MFYILYFYMRNMTYRMSLTNFNVSIILLYILIYSNISISLCLDFSNLIQQFDITIIKDLLISRYSDNEIFSKLIFYNIIIRILWYECENTCMDILKIYSRIYSIVQKYFYTKCSFNQYIVSNAIQIK